MSWTGCIYKTIDNYSFLIFSQLFFFKDLYVYGNNLLGIYFDLTYCSFSLIFYFIFYLWVFSLPLICFEKLYFSRRKSIQSTPIYYLLIINHLVPLYRYKRHVLSRQLHCFLCESLWLLFSLTRCIKLSWLYVDTKYFGHYMCVFSYLYE